jgi:hydrogenase maturation protein HypF
MGERLFELKNLKPVADCSPHELNILRTMLTRRINAPVTSSAGRLFDVAASIVGLRHETRHEGQAAMELEFALAGVETDKHYPFRLVEPAGGRGPLVVDWALLIYGILLDTVWGIPIPTISAGFHNTLAEMIVAVAKRAGEEKVVLSGGCFQNRYLTERAVSRLREEGFHPYWHQRVPPNDGGIALGQVVAASRPLRETTDDEMPVAGSR